MKYSPKDYASILYRTGDVDALVSLLAKHSVSSWLPKIISQFRLLADRKEHITRVIVKSSHALGQEERRHVERMLASQVEGKLEAVCIVDPSVIGGIRVESDEVLFAGSVRDALSRLLSLT